MYFQVHWSEKLAAKIIALLLFGYYLGIANNAPIHHSFNRCLAKLFDEEVILKVSCQVTLTHSSELSLHLGLQTIVLPQDSTIGDTILSPRWKTA
jgi:hypothetical protein